MRHFYQSLIAAAALLLAIPAHSEKVKPYKVDFNDEIDVSDHAFVPATGWDHIVGMDNWGGYLSYTYDKTGGVDGTGALRAAYSSSYNDYLVTPPLYGTASIEVQKYSYSQSIAIYKVTGSGSSLTVGDEIISSDNFDYNSWKTVSFTVDPGQRVAIKICNVLIDNFTADSADVVKQKKLRIKSVTSKNNPKYSDTDAEGNFTVAYDVLVRNNGDFDLAANDESLSLSLLNGADSSVISTTPINQALAIGATSDTIHLTKTLNIADYPDSLVCLVKENISGGIAAGSTIHPLAYKPSMTISRNGFTDELPDTTAQNLGVAQKEVSLPLTIANNGAAPLVIKTVTATGGFATTLTPQTIAAHNSVNFNVSMPPTEPGDKSGTFSVTTEDGSKYNLPLTGTVVDSTLWFADFENGQLPVDMIDEKGNSWGIMGVNNNLQLSNNTFTAYCSASMPAMLISPLLDVRKGESISFYAAPADYPSVDPSLSIYYSKDKKDWTVVRELSTSAEKEDDNLTTPKVTSGYSTTSQFKRFTVTGIPEGQYYIAFEGTQVQLDNIYGFHHVDLDHNFQFTKTNIPKTGEVNSKYTATATIRNANPKDETSESYTVSLYANGEKVATAASLPITQGNTADFTFTFTPHSATTVPVTITIEDGNYVLSCDTVNVTFGEEQATQDVQVGTPSTAGYSYARTPIYCGWGSNYAETEQIFPASKIGLEKGAAITKITFKGYIDEYSQELKESVNAWIGETTKNSYSYPYNYTDTTTLTKVMDDEAITLSPNTGSSTNKVPLFTINLSKPYIYQGGNIVLRVRSAVLSGSPQSMSPRFEVDDQASSLAIYRSASSLSGLNSAYSNSANMPVANLSISMTPKPLTGKVTNTEGEAITKAAITATSGDVLYSDSTAADGTYKLNIIKTDRDYELQATAEGYFPYKGIFSQTDTINVKNIVLHVAKGLYISDSVIPDSGNVNTNYPASITVENVENKAYADSSYTVALYVDGNEVATATGKAIAKGEKQTYSLAYTPHTEGTFKAYATVTMADGTVNTTDTTNVTIYSEPTGGQIRVGEPASSSNNVPVSTQYNTQSSSITLYKADELNIPAGSTITGLHYRGYTKTYGPYQAAFTVKMLNYDGNLNNGGDVSPDTMTTVFKDTINVSTAGTQDNFDFVYNFPLDSFQYAGKNLIVYVEVSNINSYTSYVETTSNSNGDISFYRTYQGYYGTWGTWYNNYGKPVAYLDVDYTKQATGHVYDNKLQPLAGTSVTYRSGDIIYNSTTDSTGAYSITVAQSSLPYKAIFSHKGFINDTIDVAFNGKNLVLNDTLHTSTAIVLKAFDKEDGKAIAGATVSIIKENDEVAKAITAADGTTSLNLTDAEGTYKFAFAAEGYYVDTLTAEITGDTVAVTDSLLKTRNKLSGTIYGKDLSLTKLAGALITVTTPSNEKLTATTASDGTYSLDIIHADGSYKVAISADGYISDTLTATFTGKDVELNDTLFTEVALKIENATTGNDFSNLKTADVKVYTINGALVSEGRGAAARLQRGVYIIRDKNGNSKRIAVK